MSGETNRSLIDLGNIAKPADTLVKKVSKAVGGICAPYQIKRIAKAKAEAALIKARNEIEITDLHRRAMHRFVEEEARKQQNIEDITEQAIPHLEPETDAGGMDDDWVTNFFDKSRIVSDKEMQGLWARVLAGEANKPGTYSKRTVNFLGDLDKTEAELFTKLCGFCFDFDLAMAPLIFDTQADIYVKHGINFVSLNHLDSIGLINFQVSGFLRSGLLKEVCLPYYGKGLRLEMPKETGNTLPAGQVLLTKTGQELAPICGSKPVEGFIEYVKEQWKAYSPSLINSFRVLPTIHMDTSKLT